jgi:hypothetical protein
MKLRLGPSLAFALAVSAVTSASAGDLPIIKASDKNKVPACATPGRLMSYLKSRNARLDPKFDRIAVEYMRHGEALGLRWDYAFFQMIVETGSLTFTGDVKPTQNNFAGLGATGRGAPGESFKDVSAGARAHLEHVLMYTGEHVASPVAERTRKVQEWGVLSNWRKTIKGPMSFAHLTQQWAPTSPGYARDIEAVGAAFYIDACKAADPRPGLVAEARKGRTPATTAAAEARPSSSAVDKAAASTGTALARRAVEEGRANGAARSGLGAAALVAPDEEAGTEPEATAAKKPPALTMLNAAKAETESGAGTGGSDGSAAAAGPGDKGAGAKIPPIAFASAAGAAKALAPPPTVQTKCRVWTASYGGQKAIIIRATADQATNFTVLDVNDGAEKREAEAYIAAYAKGGQTVAEFPNQAQALDKAFELCPEG